MKYPWQIDILPDTGEDDDGLPSPIWDRVRPRLTYVQDTGCWRCEGWNDGQGYAKMRVEGKCVYVHRIVYNLFNFRRVKKLTLDHSCRNMWCCNPNHLKPMFMRTNLKLRDKRRKRDKKKFLENTQKGVYVHA